MSYEKYVVIYPSVLYKEDLLELEKQLKELVNCKQCDINITATVDEHDLSAKPFHCLEDIFKEGFPSQIDQITLDVREIDQEDRLIKNIRLNINKSSGDIRIFHADDNAWVNSVYAQLNGLITKKRAWYSSIKRALPPIFNVSMIGSFFLAFPVTKTGNHFMLIFPALLIVSAGILLALSIKQALFPYSRINLFNRSEDKRPNYEARATLAELIVIALSVTGVVVLT